jgi:hypothetical protein
MRYLLATVAALMALGAGAQLKSQDAAAVPQYRPIDLKTLVAPVQEVHKHVPGEAVNGPKRSSGNIRPVYHRPAGAFYSPMVAVDGVGQMLESGYLYLKPYSEYTFYSDLIGVDQYDDLSWNYAAGWEDCSQGLKLTAEYGIETENCPIFNVYQNGDHNKLYSFQYPHFLNMGNGYTVNNYPSATILSAPNAEIIDDSGETEILLSSKTMCIGGRDGNVGTMITYYSGASPHGKNSTGWWFGKNGGDILGIAQAYEKPEHPYMLQKAYIMTTNLNCTTAVDLTLKIYKLDYIQDYDEDFPVFLGNEVGEQICYGRARITPSNIIENQGWIEFTLFCKEDGMEFEYMPTIDDAILVVFEGYNDPQANGLKNFTCYISSDYQVDEGFGELAYVKYQYRDEEGQLTGLTQWMGLNNFFNIGTMKTGFSIFLVAEHPYIAFSDPDEIGEYTFPGQGGWMTRDEGGTTINGILFMTSHSCDDEEWILTCNGSEDLPDWLEIDLSAGEQNGEYNSYVTAMVKADPLPIGINYREAVVRFEIPGDYKEFKFKQGTDTPVFPCGPLADGEVNIQDLNQIINFVLGDMYDDCYDINGDGEINIADINALIDVILM